MFTTLGEMTVADKIMNPQHFESDPADVRNRINIYIFIHGQHGSTVDIRRLNKIYNLTKKQRMKQSSPNAHAMIYTNRLAWEEKYIDSR